MIQAAQATRLSAETVRGHLDQVFERPEFSPEGASWLEQALDELSDFLASTDLPESAGWVLLALLILALCVFAFLLLRRLSGGLRALRAGRRRAAGQAPAAAVFDARERVSELQQLARQALERGDLALALRLSFFALVVGLSGRQELEYRDSWTNRELVERGRPSPSIAAELADLVAWIEAKTFGREPVEAADLERVERLWQRAQAGAGAGP